MFLEVMEKCRVGSFRRSVVYWGVRLFGWQAWRANAKDKQQGIVRRAPKEYVPIPPDFRVTWTEYQKIIEYEHLKENRP
jgi:hypothetical protein